MEKGDPMAEKTAGGKIGELRDRLAKAQHLVVLTGAGISAESGVPTFRGQDGLWRQYRAMDLATPEAFLEDPKLVWEFYNWRRELLAPLCPNPGHLGLVELEKRLPKFTLITQNIDGLHQVAGSRNMLELHGNLWWVRCTACGMKEEDRTVPLPALPKCRSCGGLLRPHVVWFGEMLEPPVLNASYEAIEQSDVMLVIGTSGTVQPAASMGVLAKRTGSLVAEINLDPTPYTDAYHISISGKAGDVIPRLVDG